MISDYFSIKRQENHLQRFSCDISSYLQQEKLPEKNVGQEESQQAVMKYT